MQFVERYEAFCRIVNDDVISLGTFDTHEEAVDAAIRFASEELPTERVKAFQVQHVYLNATCYPAEIIFEDLKKGG
jgi:hypothetical protein